MGQFNVGLIGYGYWGPNLARNFDTHPACRLVKIADLSGDRRTIAAQQYKNAEITKDAKAVHHASDIDIVVISTPVNTHYELAKKALEQGKHVWIEKPMARTWAQCQELVDLAQRKAKTIIVDHTFLFTGAVRKIKELMDNDILGAPLYFDSVRINLGLLQNDVNVFWDLATHDLSIMDYLLGQNAKAISAQGMNHINSKEDVGYLTIHYDNKLLAHVHVNWLSPVKIRKTVIGGSKKMLVWDALESDASVKVYDRGVDIVSKEGRYDMLASYRMGEMYAPMLHQKEALTEEVDYFIDCLKKGVTPFNDAAAGARIVRLLELADLSLKSNGATIAVN
jgi:predicted dehydrogenase